MGRKSLNQIIKMKKCIILTLQNMYSLCMLMSNLEWVFKTEEGNFFSYNDDIEINWNYIHTQFVSWVASYTSFFSLVCTF